MREVQIFHESEGQPKRMIGALWVRGKIEISEDGVIGYSEIRDSAQLCMTLPGKISYVMAMGDK